MKYYNLSVFYKDAEAKRLGINNRPAEKYIDNILELNHDLIEPLRDAWGKFCKKEYIGSPEWNIIAGYRCDELNKHYEGLKSSPHLKGFAVDFTLENNQYAVFMNFAGEWLRNEGIRFDEIVWKIDQHYIHLSIKNNEGKQRSHIKKEKGYGKEKILDRTVTGFSPRPDDSDNVGGTIEDEVPVPDGRP